MTKFKAGDKFIPHKPKEDNPDLSWVEEMDIYDGKTQIVERIKGKYLITESEWYFHPDWCEKVEDNQSVETNEMVADNHVPEVGKMVDSSEIPNNHEHIVEANKMIDWEQREWDASVASMQAISTAIFSNREAASTMLKRAQSENLDTMELIMKISIENAKELVKQLKGGKDDGGECIPARAANTVRR